MPKRTNTRKIKAAELLRHVTDGPSFSFEVFGRVQGADLTPAQRKEIQDHFEAQVRIWLHTWVKPMVKQLIPELWEPRS